MSPEPRPSPEPHDPPGSAHSPPATFLDRAERVLLRIILGALVVLALLLGFAAWHARQQRATPAPSRGENLSTTVTLVIDYGDGARKSFTDLLASPGMTVLDAMNAAKSHALPLAFTTTGSGDTTLLHSIDGVANQGSNGRNWQYWIDGTFGMSSIGVARVHAGQRVSWALRPYDSDPKPPPP